MGVLLTPSTRSIGSCRRRNRNCKVTGKESDPYRKYSQRSRISCMKEEVDGWREEEEEASDDEGDFGCNLLFFGRRSNPR